ncbi:MAG TPA: exosortase/archaeosortase family protein [Acidimicrobiales bacterium]|nr:exosortase/archaeosortase family protein [Acidimicrobiales bacterium]
MAAVSPVELGTGNAGPVGARRGLARRWDEASPPTRTTVKVVALLGATLCAYSYSLTTLLQTATMQTPLAYISLVPLIALGLAAMQVQPGRAERAIHDRQLDYIVGIPLVALAIAINVTLPAKFSAMFWVWRIDLLSLPFFVAGAVAILFGVRVVWRQKLAIAYLFLAWPWPYTTLLLRVLDASTDTTLAGLRFVLRFVHVATPEPSAGTAVFQVVHAGHPFPVSVVSACSGINGIVGFLLVGVAFGAIVRGPLARKGAWLAAGMVLLWAVNLGRLTFIFWAGHLWGESVAINVLHPFVGLVTFSVGVLLMLLAMGRFGLRIKAPAPRAGDPDLWGTGVPVRPAPAVPRAFAAIAIVCGAAVFLAFADNALRAYNLVANAAGEPKLLAFQASPTAPAGWDARPTEIISWAKPLFGDDSTWIRYTFYPGQGGGDLHASDGVTADVVDTTDEQAFAAYSVEACYQFHGWLLQDVAQVSVGGGITGQTLSFTAPGDQSWSVLYWIVPVQAGQQTHYERFVLYLINAPGGAHVQLPKGVTITNLAGSIGGTAHAAVLAQNRAFLVTFAHELIVKQAQDASRLDARLASGVAPGQTGPGGRPLAAAAAPASGRVPYAPDSR